MTRLLHLRSIRAAIVRGERRLADLDAKRTELVGSIAELRDMLPEAERPAAYITLRSVPEGMKGTGGSGAVVPGETGGHGGSDDPKAPQATDALEFKSAGHWVPPTPAREHLRVLAMGGGNPDSQITEAAVLALVAKQSAELVEHASGTAGAVSTNDAQGQRVIRHIVAKQMGDAIVRGRDAYIERIAKVPRKPGWPPGLSRKLTPCPQSTIPHRHRVDDPSKPTELTCVGITYPEKTAAPPEDGL